jgi:hypothetical protein
MEPSVRGGECQGSARGNSESGNWRKWTLSAHVGRPASARLSSHGARHVHARQDRHHSLRARRHEASGNLTADGWGPLARWVTVTARAGPMPKTEFRPPAPDQGAEPPPTRIPAPPPTPVGSVRGRGRGPGPRFAWGRGPAPVPAPDLPGGGGRRPRLARIGDQVVPQRGLVRTGLPQSAWPKLLLLGTAAFQPGNVR